MAQSDVNPADIRRVLENSSFKALTQRREQALMAAAMAEGTSTEETLQAKADYLALRRLMAALRAASNQEAD